VRRVPAIAAVAPFWILAVIFAASQLSVSEEKSSILSPSPMNTFFAGTSSFYSAISSQAKVILAGPSEAARLALEGERVAYLLIGPDKPLSQEEVEVLVEAYKTGRLALLVADETGNANNLLEALDAPHIDGRLPGIGSGGGWELMVQVACEGLSGSFYTGLADKVEGGTPICWAHTGDPIASIQGGILVVGDSSLFSNYLYNGFDSLPSTMPAAHYLASKILENTTIVVYDVKHYETVEGRLGLAAAPRLLAALASTANGMASSIEGLRGVALLAVASIPWAVILSPPTTPPGGVKDEVGEAVKRLKEAVEEGA